MKILITILLTMAFSQGALAKSNWKKGHKSYTYSQSNYKGVYVGYKTSAWHRLSYSQKKQVNYAVRSGKCKTAVGCFVRFGAKVVRVVWTGSFTVLGHAIYKVSYVTGRALKAVSKGFKRCGLKAWKNAGPFAVLGLPCELISAVTGIAGDGLLTFGSGAKKALTRIAKAKIRSKKRSRRRSNYRRSGHLESQIFANWN